MKDIQDILIANLIALRRHRGLTQIELGEQVNYSDKTISKWENGDSCPGIEALYRLATFYGVRVDDLLQEDFSPGAPISAEEARAEKQRRYSKLVISLLAVMAVWVIATILFVAGMLNGEPMVWLFFIDAIPCSCITLLVFNSLWGRARMNYLIITVLLWTLLTAIYLHVHLYQLWAIFLLGIPVQIAVILWSQLKRGR
jgi:transcriptional regulator with XRE-family HTH domain